MRVNPVIIVVLGLLGVVSSAYAQTQAEMDETACNEYKKTDAKLTAMYNKILKDYADDKEFIKNFKKSQQAWTAYRDAQVQALYPKREHGYYGSILPVCTCNTSAYLTENRIKELKQWIDGAEQGDSCAGSVKYQKVTIMPHS